MSPMCYNTLLLDHVLQHSSPGDTVYTHTHAIHTKHIHNNTVPTSTSNCLFTYKFTNSRSEKIFFYCHYTCSTLFIIFFLRISRNLLKLSVHSHSNCILFQFNRKKSITIQLAQTRKKIKKTKQNQKLSFFGTSLSLLVVHYLYFPQQRYSFYFNRKKTLAKIQSFVNNLGS